MQEKIKKLGEFLLIISLFSFAVSIPTSIALDGFSAGLGILGYLILLLTQNAKPVPPLKPLFFLLIPEILSVTLKFPAKLLKTDFNHKLTPYFTIYRTVSTRENLLRKVLFVLGISSLVLSLSVIFEAFTGQNVKHLNWHHLTLHLNPIRSKGLLNHPLTTAGVIFLLLFLFLSFFLQVTNFYYLLVTTFLLIALILTGSRSYWVGLTASAVSIFFFFLKEEKFRRKILVVFGISALIFAVSYQLPYVKYRVKSITNTENNWSNLDRLALWRAHLKAFVDDYPITERIFGSGYKASKYAWKEFRESYRKILGKEPPGSLKQHFHGGLTHNIYLKFLTKYGILGLLGFLAFWFYVFYENFKAFKRIPQNRIFLEVLTAGYIGFLTAGFFENNFTDAEIKYAIMFILALNFLFTKEDIFRLLSGKG